MTRFARAKGSKSSNERTPDEATPWNVMKMQLEDSQASSKAIVKKAKTAKELIAEKDELFYHDTTGNVNHEWAAFDDVKERKSDDNKSGKLSENKNSKRDKKKLKNVARLLLSSNDDPNKELIVKVVEKVENQSQNNSQANGESETTKMDAKSKLKSKKKYKNETNGIIGAELDSKEHAEPKNLDENKANDSKMELNSPEPVSNEKSHQKNKKNKKKSRKTKSIIDSGQSIKESETVGSESQQIKKDLVTTDVDSDKKEILSSNVERSGERLSKRQKRNQKKQRKIMSEKNESKINVDNEESEKEKTPQGFDVSGNDWSNEVKFGKQSNLHRLSTSVNTGGDNRMKVDNKKKENINKKNIDVEKESEGDETPRNDNPIPDNSENQKQDDNNTLSRKDLKRKGGKNDNKEHKRRKPDEGVIKMIINGNEIEVVKYDGFPVKKDDAERLQELKKNMIIKGIPRSEINVAMKLERRKAEKSLARERKRVCFHCRRSGHNLSDCPELGRDESGTGICFKCGSAEHTHFECKVVKGQEFRHASCFICREQGHIAKQCPDNPKGLYPQGGGCKMCGDVTHLKKDCPDVIKEKEETNITADKIVGNKLESLEEDEENTTKNVLNDIKPRNRIIKF